MDTKKEALMEEAKALGLEPHHATGQLKLQEMIAAEQKRLADESDSGVDEISDEDLLKEQEATKAKDDEEEDDAVEPEIKKIRALTAAQRNDLLRKRQTKLVRVVVHCNNDKKKEWTGEIHTVICAAGVIKKWVPFNNEKGWHVPQAILDVMSAKTCQKFRSAKLPNGQEHNVSYSVKEYNIEVLPPLTREQLDNLAKEQAARGSIHDS